MTLADLIRARSEYRSRTGHWPLVVRLTPTQLQVLREDVLKNGRFVDPLDLQKGYLLGMHIRPGDDYLMGGYS